MDAAREIWALLFFVSCQMLMMINPKACFSRHSQWPPKSFRLAGLESLCCSILPWMSETYFPTRTQQLFVIKCFVHISYLFVIFEFLNALFVS
jgi:hypothetical protein